MNLRMASIFITLSTLIRFSTPSLEKDVWKDLSDNLKQELAPLHHHISRCNNPDDIKVLGDQCTIVIRNFLSNHSELFEDENKQSSKFRSHSNKTLAQLLELKKTLRKEAFKKDADPSKRKQFHNCLKALNDLKHREKIKSQNKTAVFQEKQFNKNRWKFSKQVVNGTFGSDEKQPSFNKAAADDFYPRTYSVPKVINLENLNWITQTGIAPDSPDFAPFDNTPIKPKDIKRVLTKANLKSAPGPDGIPYGVLLKLESCHHILATLFNKVFSMGSPPSSWGESVVKLAHKKDDTADPSNF
jgi:hypothetical protein